MNNKYDKIINKNEQMYVPLSQAVQQRIGTIQSSLLTNAKKQFKEFIERGEATVTDDQLTDLFGG